MTADACMQCNIWGARVQLRRPLRSSWEIAAAAVVIVHRENCDAAGSAAL